MKTSTELRQSKWPRRVFILAERWILSLAMTVVALVVERRLIKAIKRTA
jgi:hypothetical protein